MIRLRTLGLNYIYGLINYTLGVICGGICVALILIARGLVR